MVSPRVLMEATALPTRVKYEAMSQDLVWRLSRCDLLHTKQDLAKITNNFIVKLKLSGYSLQQRKEIAAAGIKGYWRRRQDELLGVKRINNPKQVGLTQRRRKKWTAKSSWFKPRLPKVAPEKGQGPPPAPSRSPKAGDPNRDPTRSPTAQGKTRGDPSTQDNAEKKKVEGVIWVPVTPKGALRKIWQKVINTYVANKEMGTIKVVEEGGRSLISILGVKDPWSQGMGCGR